MQDSILTANAFSKRVDAQCTGAPDSKFEFKMAYTSRPRLLVSFESYCNDLYKLFDRQSDC
ncbi:protein of unknown function [Paraburkholderia kururiensis]